jgi:ribokinase
MAPRIAVVGAAGVGILYRAPLPAPGETVLAERVEVTSGGKSANQALGAAVLGAEVELVTAVGDDALAAVVRAALRAHGVGERGVIEIENACTMVGAVLVDPGDGENRIVVAPGALAAVGPGHVAEHEAVIAGADVCLVGLDGFPVAAAGEALAIARRHGVATVFNPAPASEPEALRALLPLVDHLTPNRGEAAALRGRDGAPGELAAGLLEQGAGAVAITCGADGVLLAGPDGARETVPPEPIPAVVDTSGAGDAFNAGFAVALAAGLPAREACVHGCRAAARTLQGVGFVPALALWEGLTI